METLFDQYKELNINGSLICLEQVEKRDTAFSLL